ncbi:MAG: hypothetical protein AAGF95_27895 [Chloroflexota bacterium]
MATSDVTLDQVLALARRLRPVDQAQLIARLAPNTQHLLKTTQSTTSLERPPLRGLLADLGTAPTDSDIAEVQQEMWATFSEDSI